MLVLPSGRLLRKYKNKIPQCAGLNEDMFRWILEAAREGQ
jgi:hypothetical protein